MINLDLSPAMVILVLEHFEPSQETSINLICRHCKAAVQGTHQEILTHLRSCDQLEKALQKARTSTSAPSGG